MHFKLLKFNSSSDSDILEENFTLTQNPDFSIEEKPNFRLLDEDEGFFVDQDQGN